MSHLFISYASADQAIATEVCALLEARGVSCWIAPRDVPAGAKWDEALLHAIDEASAFLLLLSTASNQSPFVQNEVNRAFGKQKAIFTLRIEDVAPAGSLEFYLARHHWTDGFKGRLEDRIGELVQSVVATQNASSPASPGAVSVPSATGPVAPVRRVRVSRRWPRWIVPAAAALTGALVAAPATWLLRPTTDAPLYRSSLLPPDKVVWGNTTPSTHFVISPDGRKLAFLAAGTDGVTRLWIRQLDTLSAQPLPGTDGVINAFWSPDSRRIAFSALGKLSVISADGGAANVIGTAGNTGGSWNADNLILFEPESAGVSKVPASGGAPSAVLGQDRADGEGGQWQPFFLPDGKHFLYHLTFSNTHRNGAVMVASIDDPHDRKLLVDVGSNAQYSRGFILFMRGTTLMAQRFDASRLELQGDAVAIAEHVPIGGSTGRTGAFSVSQNGVLVYETSVTTTPARLTWYDRAGKPLAVVPDSSDLGDVELSPDASRVAVTRFNAAANGRDIWVLDLKRGVRNQLTFDPTDHGAPIWSPDGTAIFYVTRPRDGGDSRVAPAIRQMSATGLADPQTMYEAAPGSIVLNAGITADGRTLLFNVGREGSLALWQLALHGDRQPVAVRPPIASAANGPGLRYSPNRRWIAYVSSETGQNQVFIAPAAGGPARWQISQAGGVFPRWRRDGKELYFVATSGVMANDIAEGPAGIEAGAPHRLFTAHPRFSVRYAYDVTADGQQFLVAEDGEQPPISPVTLVVNWDAQLNGAKK